MSEQQNAEVRAEEPELSDESIEQVAGGCHVGQSVDFLTISEPTTIDY